MTQSVILEAALHYAARGWRVVPLHYPTGDPERPCSCRRADCDKVGKHPQIMAWPQNASTDEQKIRRWWSQWPKANVGIACGEQSGLWVMDVDGAEGKNCLRHLRMDNQPDLPITPRSITGSGGEHYLFLYEPGLKNEVRFAPGLDIRTEGGLIVAPPSIHGTGAVYEWASDADPDEVPVQAAPEWLIRLIRAAAREAAPRAAITEGKIPAGKRNATLWSSGCAMRRWGMSEKEILAALSIANQERCDPPLTDEEIRDLAQRAARYEPAAAEVTLSVNGRQAVDDVFEPEEEEALARSDFRFYTFEEILQLPPPEWQVEDLFPETSFLQIFGQTWSGKSLVMMDLALNIAKGTKSWCGRKILKNGPVVWINADGGRGITPRSVAWAETNGQEFEYPFLVLMGNVQLNRADQIGAFRLQLMAMDPRPVLVVFDTLSRCIPGVDENNQAEMTKVTDACHRIKLDVGCTVCLIHHTDKTGQWDRGSSIVKNETDTQIRVTKEDGSNVITIHSCKARDAAAFQDFYLEIHPVADSAIVVQRDGPGPRTGHEEKEDRLAEVLLMVIQKPGITFEQLAVRLEVSVRTVERYAKDLIEARDVLEADLPRIYGQRGPARKGLFPTPKEQ